MSDPFIGEIILFAGNFAPRGWAFCAGQILSIQQNTALYSILGTTYGGNGTTTYALPDLRGRVPMGVGQGPGLTPRSLGEVAGTESVTLNANEMPAHVHPLPASTHDSTTKNPQGNVPAYNGSYGTPASADTTMSPSTQSGGSQPHGNMQPYTGLNYIIALEGIFPSRN
jgi:microcystin-dependent protein